MKTITNLNSMLSKVPEDLLDIYELCKHEIDLVKDAVTPNVDILMNFYKVLYYISLNEYFGLLMERPEKVTIEARKHLTKSKTRKEALDNFLKVYDPHHPMRFAIEMQYYTKIKFENFDQDPRDIFYLVLCNKLLGEPILHISKSKLNKILKDNLIFYDEYK